MKLRLGLMRFPGDIVARRALAELYLAMNRRPLALKVFGGLAPATYPGREYLAVFFAAASEVEDFDPLPVKCCNAK